MVFPKGNGLLIKTLVPVLLVAFNASGCAATEAAMEPATTPHPIIVVSPPSTPSPSEDMQVPTIDVFACEEPLPANLQWLYERYGSLTWDAADVRQVLVGSGNDPDEQWWLFAVRDYNAATNARQDMAFLTNAPSAVQSEGEVWIRVDRYNVQSGIVDDGWELVHWPADRIEKGRRAEAFACACLE